MTTKGKKQTKNASRRVEVSWGAVRNNVAQIEAFVANVKNEDIEFELSCTDQTPYFVSRDSTVRCITKISQEITVKIEFGPGHASYPNFAVTVETFPAEPRCSYTVSGIHEHIEALTRAYNVANVFQAIAEETIDFVGADTCEEFRATTKMLYRRYRDR